MVVGILDGDTIKVLTEEKEEKKIRLYGIDTPEKKQDFGQAAKKFTSKLIFQKNIKVDVKDIDRYGRTIGIVILEDEKVLNEEILKAGFAWWYRKYAPKEWRYMKLEREAKEKKLGIWSNPTAIPPWEWRRKKKRNQA